MKPQNSTSPHPIRPTSSSEPSNSRIRRHGKIARLPSELRELVNVMLHEGAPYASIIKTLRQHGQHLNQANLSRWHAGGFADWLRHQAWLEEMRARLDFASEIVQEPNAEFLDQASLRIAITRMYTLLTQFDPAVLQLKIAETPGAYPRILNALCKLTETALKLQRHRGQQPGKLLSHESPVRIPGFSPPDALRVQADTENSDSRPESVP